MSSRAGGINFCAATSPIPVEDFLHQVVLCLMEAIQSESDVLIITGLFRVVIRWLHMFPTGVASFMTRPSDIIFVRVPAFECWCPTLVCLLIILLSSAPSLCRLDAHSSLSAVSRTLEVCMSAVCLLCFWGSWHRVAPPPLQTSKKEAAGESWVLWCLAGDTPFQVGSGRVTPV